MYPRTLNVLKLLDKKSFFLFGPRSTGKSTLVRQQLAEHARVYDLLDANTYGRLLRSPSVIEQDYLAQSTKYIVIDEIQKLPSLLDEVHRLIEKRRLKFLL